MTRYKKIEIKKLLKDFLWENIPNKRDDLIQIVIKTAFLLCIIGILSGSIYFGGYYFNYYSEQRVIHSDRELFVKKNGEKLLKKQNSDYTAWITIEGTQLNNPVYKSNDNSFYLTHNSLNKKSRYGSLFLDYRFDFSDKNTVIYGNCEDNVLFSTLKKLRQLDFYKNNSVITVTHEGLDTFYRIYAVFVMNSSKSQDNGKIYSVYQNKFSNKATFENWVNDARERSVIDTKVDVSEDDKILTLITSCDDFEGARLVVMAKSTDEADSMADNTNATLNANPKYPQKWYDVRNIKYPF